MLENKTLFVTVGYGLWLLHSAPVMLAAAAVPLTTPAAPVNTTLRATDAWCYVRAQEEEQR